jgi:hypothetical protein
MLVCAQGFVFGYHLEVDAGLEKYATAALTAGDVYRDRAPKVRLSSGVEAYDHASYRARFYQHR